MSKETSPLARLMAFVTDAPEFEDRGWRKIVVMGRGAMPGGALIHGVWAGLFWFLDQPELAIFNIGSAALWIWASVSLYSPLTLTEGRIRWIIWLCVLIELPAHAVVATVTTGLAPAFHLYLLGALATMPVLHFLHPSARLSVALALIPVYVGIVAYSARVAPISPMSEGVALWFAATNSFAATGQILILGLMMTTASMQAEARIQAERERADGLLLNILPAEIADRLKASPDIIAQDYDEATILFADIVGFTETSARMKPAELVRRLNLVFSAFDALTAKHGVEKIKTIGDAYMVVAGLPSPRPDHAEVMCALARDMLAEVDRINETIEGEPVRIRIGLNSGPVVAGVIGKSKFAYDLWGDAVNVAARMEQLGVAGEARMTDATHDRLGEAAPCRDAGEVEVKGKGRMRVWSLSRA